MFFREKKGCCVECGYVFREEDASLDRCPNCKTWRRCPYCGNEKLERIYPVFPSSVMAEKTSGSVDMEASNFVCKKCSRRF